jgi:predicted MPP superfamily phosphohydrolase
MRILHIGDLHFKKRGKYEQSRIIEALILSIRKNKPIDLIFFSGDLINNGTNSKDFTDAHNFLFTPLQKETNIDLSNIFICCGNHDIDRTVIVNSIVSYFFGKKKIDSKMLETWFTKQIPDKKASLNSSHSFFNYLTGNFTYQSQDDINILYSIHKREIEGKQIGIVTLNTSWFCSGERDDKGELLVLPSILEEAVNKIEDCDLKILMQHHPLNYLKQTISYEIEDVIHSNFNILLIGHVHKEFLETQYRCNNGIYCNTTKASLCDDGGEIGYSILNLEMNDVSSIKVERFHYIKSENRFNTLEPVIITIPLGESKHKQNSIRKKIKSKFATELNEANKLLLDYNDTNEHIFLETFTNPILSKDSDEETNLGDTVTKIQFEDLMKFEHNYLLFGKDKSGKTSLLKKIQLDLLSKYSNESLIPLYLDYKQLELADGDLDINKLVTHYYQISKADANAVIQGKKLLLLVDNLDTNSSLHGQIISFLSSHQEVKFVICSEYLTSRIFGEELDDLSYKKYFFKNLTRKELRLYAQKNSAIKDEDQELVIEKVTNFCKQLHLPLSYWTISLILLIYKKSNDDYSKNLFSVLDTCVDEILMKKRFLFEKTNLKFEQYKSMCAEIAKELFQNYSETEYSCTYPQLFLIVESYRSKNPRIVTGTNFILDFLFESGILKKKLDGNCTFRLNGIFEYFLAYQIKEDDIFKTEILNSAELYLAFKNEIEIYSGFNRSDVNFLRDIYKKTKDALEPFKATYHLPIDETLLGKIDGAYHFEKSFKKLLLEAPLSDSKKDLIFDKVDSLDIDSEVHRKELLDVNNLNVEVVEKYITILSRVLKNSDGITHSDLIYEIFDYLLETYCQFGFFIIDEFENNAKKENIKLREEYELEDDIILGEEILKLLSRILPVLVQAMMYDGLGQTNFFKIIENRIGLLRHDLGANQYKLFVLYFLLLDIDLKSNKSLIDDVFEEIKLAPLKVATLFKLNFYLAFKAYKNKNLEELLKNKIQFAQKRIDSKIDIGEIQKSLSKTSKRNLIKKKRI